MECTYIALSSTPKHFSRPQIHPFIHTMGAAAIQGDVQPIGKHFGLSVLPKDTTINKGGAGFDLPTPQSLDYQFYRPSHSHLFTLS